MDCLVEVNVVHRLPVTQPFSMIMDAARNILLVDDDHFLREAVAYLIRTWSFQVTAAETLQTAKESFLAGRPFGVVVSDFQLPDGTGLELLAWLRETQKSQVPFLLVSGSYAPPNVDGFVYLAKPYRPEDLRARINQLAGLT